VIFSGFDFNLGDHVSGAAMQWKAKKPNCGEVHQGIQLLKQNSKNDIILFRR